MNGFQLDKWTTCQYLMTLYEIEWHTSDQTIVLRKKNKPKSYYEYTKLYESNDLMNVMIFVDGYSANENYKRMNKGTI